MSTTDKTYNGWTNYETWAVGLFLGGNYTGEGDYLYARELVAESVENYNRANVDNAIWTVDEAKTFAVEDSLKTWIEEAVNPGEDTISGLAADLLGAALSEVNWRELAEHQIADLAE